MLNFGWAEMLVIGVVALIVIGPEDLPQMFRQLGRFTGKLRTMSREFSRAMEQAAKESGVNDVAKDIRTATSAKSLGLEAVRSAADKFEKWDPIKNAAKPSNPAAVGSKPLVPPPIPATPRLASAQPPAAATVAEDLLAEDLLPEDLLEEVEDLAFGEEEADEGESRPAPAAPVAKIGPATQALYDKQRLRAQVLAEQAEKLRAIEAGTYEPAPKAPEEPATKAPEPATVAPAMTTPEAPAAAAAKPRKTSAKAKAEAPVDASTEGPKTRKPRKKAEA